MTTNQTQQNTTDAKAKLAWIASLTKWLTTVLKDQTHPIHQKLSTEHKTFLQGTLDGALQERVKTKFKGVIDPKDLKNLPTTLQSKQQAFVKLLEDSTTTIDKTISGLLDATDALLTSGVQTLQDLALFCIDEVYKILELAIKLLRNLELSELLPHWLTQRINNGQPTNALSFFLALPKSKLKALLSTATAKQ